MNPFAPQGHRGLRISRGAFNEPCEIAQCITPIKEYLADLLAQADRQMNRQLDVRLKPKGVPVEQWRILKAPSDKGGCSMGDLADAVQLNHPTLTKIFDRMISSA
jgi:MarR family transcriptional regulator, organic hydroperoxide resistance regulator